MPPINPIRTATTIAALAECTNASGIVCGIAVNVLHQSSLLGGNFVKRQMVPEHVRGRNVEQVFRREEVHEYGQKAKPQVDRPCARGSAGSGHRD